MLGVPRKRPIQPCARARGGPGMLLRLLARPWRGHRIRPVTPLLTTRRLSLLIKHWGGPRDDADRAWLAVAAVENFGTREFDEPTGDALKREVDRARVRDLEASVSLAWLSFFAVLVPAIAATMFWLDPPLGYWWQRLILLPALLLLMLSPIIFPIALWFLAHAALDRITTRSDLSRLSRAVRIVRKNSRTVNEGQSLHLYKLMIAACDWGLNDRGWYVRFFPSWPRRPQRNARSES